MTARTLMIQGTCSSAGKSLLTAALCRIFQRKGIRVTPFKAQNMSNNAAVCQDGSEIGRSQALQALAAGVEPTYQMNPVLLKPEADSRSQVIVNGRPWNHLNARDYFERSQALWTEITTALDTLREQYELIIIEGAGSPAELNLQEFDLVNMRVAHYAEAPVLLVGNIELGGIFAQLLGTQMLLPEADRQLLRGFIVNKFRGDQSLFDEGVTELEQRSGLPVLGVIPWIPNLRLPEEDAAPVEETRRQQATSCNDLDIAVIYLPRISNLDDVDALRYEPDVSIRFVRSVDRLGSPDAIILPGTKNTLDDLEWLRQTGLASAISEAAATGTEIVGICGGYQMLGTEIENPNRIESDRPSAEGLSLLPVRTVFENTNKQTRQTTGIVSGTTPVPETAGMTVSGYEIHQGRSESSNGWLSIEEEDELDGAATDNHRIWGCYLHGLMTNDEFRTAWIQKLRFQRGDRPMASVEPVLSFAERTEQELNRLADAVESAIGEETLMQLAGLKAGSMT